jgi:hypothetical protein
MKRDLRREMDGEKCMERQGKEMDGLREVDEMDG